MKIYLICVDVREEDSSIENMAFRKVLAKNEDSAKKKAYKALKEENEFDDFDHFEELIQFCEEIDTTTPLQQFGVGY